MLAFFFLSCFFSAVKWSFVLASVEYRPTSDSATPKVGITFLNFSHKISNKYCSLSLCFLWPLLADINYRCFYIQSSRAPSPALGSLRIAISTPKIVFPQPSCTKRDTLYPRHLTNCTMPNKLTNRGHHLLARYSSFSRHHAFKRGYITFFHKATWIIIVIVTSRILCYSDCRQCRLLMKFHLAYLLLYNYPE